MLEQYYVRPETADRIRASWLGGPIEQYVDWLTANGYKARNVFHRVPFLMHFGDYAHAHGASRWDELPHHVDGFVRSWIQEHGQHRSDQTRKNIEHEVRGPVEQLLTLIVEGFQGSGRRKAEAPFRRQAPGFYTYLRQEKGLRETSVTAYQQHLRRFETYLAHIGLTDLATLSPAVLSAFVIEGSTGLGKSSVRDLCGRLRVFLRYLYREQLISRDISSTVESPQNYRLSDIPRSIEWGDVQKVLASIERRSVVGKRDYAMLLLLVTYGLRAREVAALTLDDIDWRNERLRIPERKAGHSTVFPLSATVGSAILDYIQNGRPKTADRHVFLRVLAPPRHVTYVVVSNQAARYLHKAGIEVPRAGSHTLRHTCVQRLVDTGFSLKAIGDYVGHRVPASTEIYSKVDVESLREVALGDGEDIL